MIYLLKFTLASGLLWSVYHFWLEQEKMNQFKRFYLLFSLLFAALVPVLQLPDWSNGAAVKALEAVQYVHIMPPVQEAMPTPARQARSSALLILPMLYALVCGILLLRYGFGIYQLVRQSTQNTSQRYGRFRLAFLPQAAPAHSFLRTIFISKEDYNHPQLAPVILGHELAHLRQGHSIDLLLIELLRVFFWFNPFLFLYKRAIQLNHEFLADEAVLQEQKLEASTYQLMLLSKIVLTQAASLAHAFDYSITKKRLIMMTKMAKPQWLWFKKLALLPLLAGIMMVLCDKTQAQSTAKVSPPKVLAQNTTTKQEGVPEALMDEYKVAIKKIQDTVNTQQARNAKWINLSGINAERTRVNAIYYHMSPEQRANAPVINKALPMLPPAKKAPTATQLQTWLGSDSYGIWIDGKKVDNGMLKNFKAEDFDWFLESKLANNAIPPGSLRRYQINLYTHAGYQKAYIDARKL